jgi:hypothetical protein
VGEIRHSYKIFLKPEEIQPVTRPRPVREDACKLDLKRVASVVYFLHLARDILEQKILLNFIVKFHIFVDGLNKHRLFVKNSVHFSKCEG